MNLVLTSQNLRECAQALDNWRLHKQIEVLMQLQSTILRENTTFTSMLETYIDSRKGNKAASTIKLSILTNTHSNHPLHEWSIRSLFHAHFITKYINQCWLETRRRGLTSHAFNTKHVAAFQISSWACDALEYIINPEIQFFTHKDLYSSTDFPEEKDIYKAYQKHLTMRWVADINKEIEYCRTITSLKEGQPKPRKPRMLSWNNSPTPKFAIAELAPLYNLYSKEKESYAKSKVKTSPKSNLLTV